MTDKGKDRRYREERSSGVGGFLDGLSNVLEKLGELAEKGEELRKSGEFGGPDSNVRGVYGFRIRTGLGREDVEVEPFGNVREDEETGEAVVSETSEPLVDVFDEEGHVLVVAEMPGVGEEDIDLDLKDDILTIAAERGQKKYRKEVLLPTSFTPEQVSHTCRNGVLEVRLDKESEKGQQK